VFGERLRQLRELRGLTQAQLADQVTANGTPLNREAVMKIERGGRRVDIEEVVALTWALQGVLVQLLTPPGNDLLALSDGIAVDAEGLSNFLLYGDPVLAAPAAFDDETVEVVRGRLDRILLRHALALTDASRANDEHGMKVAGAAIVAAVRVFNAKVDEHNKAKARKGRK